MADINLLPEEFRAKDAETRKKVSKKPEKVEVPLTSPEKVKDVTTKKGFWKKIFGGDAAAPTPLRVKENGVAPAEQKVSFKQPKTSVDHLPEKETSKKASEESAPHSLSSVEVGGEPVKSTPPPLVNKHLSDFQKESEKSKKDPEIILHEPEQKTEEQRDVAITFDKEGDKKPIGEKMNGGIGAIVGALRTVVNKFARRGGDEPILVNLMPERRLSLKDVNWSRITRMLIISVGGAAAITVFWYLFLLDQERRDQQEFDAIQGEIATLRVQIAKLEDDQKEAFLLKDRLDRAGDLLKNHIYWTQFLALLEELTLDGVYFDGLNAVSIDEGDRLELSGVATDLETVFWQRETFRANDMVKRAEVTDAQVVSEGGGEESKVIERAAFSIELDLDPSIWKR